MHVFTCAAPIAGARTGQRHDEDVPTRLTIPEPALTVGNETRIVGILRLSEAAQKNHLKKKKRPSPLMMIHFFRNHITNLKYFLQLSYFQTCCVFIVHVCLFPVTGPFHAVGLVNLPGRLRQTVLQVPASQPAHCTGPAGEVSPHPFIHPFIYSAILHLLVPSGPALLDPVAGNSADLSSLSQLQLNIL